MKCGGTGIESIKIGDASRFTMSVPPLLQWENHILPMNMEKLFSIVDGVCTRDLRGTVFDYVQSLIEMENFPALTNEYLLDQLFLSWITSEKTMIIDMLNSANAIFQSHKENE